MEASRMNIGPKMAFILRVYQMTESENAEDIEHDREMVRAGVMSARTYDKRRCTRDIARRNRRRDDTGRWPRDVRKKRADSSVIVRVHTLQ
jgi:predicted RecB family endonuclease